MCDSPSNEKIPHLAKSPEGRNRENCSSLGTKLESCTDSMISGESIQSPTLFLCSDQAFCRTHEYTNSMHVGLYAFWLYTCNMQGINLSICICYVYSKWRSAGTSLANTTKKDARVFLSSHPTPIIMQQNRSWI